MSRLTDIPIDQFDPRIFKLWAKDWLLLTAGDLAGNRFNPMAVGWGGFGIMWTLPIAMVVVRPQRHTRTFLESSEGFTLCAFPEAQRKAVAYCGAHSGRDVDKMSETGLTPLASTQVSAPGYAEADLWIECRKIYFNDFDPANFIDPRIAKNYPSKDYHRMYFGEVLAVRAVASSH